MAAVPLASPFHRSLEIQSARQLALCDAGWLLGFLCKFALMGLD